MSKLKRFLHTYLNSAIPQQKYYHKLVKTKYHFTVKYFIILIFILSFFTSIFSLVNLSTSVGGINDFLTNLKQGLSNYPQNLVVSVKEGRLATNYDRPYIFWLNNNGRLEPILVIDQYADDFFKIDSYQIPILITARGIAVKDNDQIHIYKFNRKLNLLVTAKTIDKIESILKNIITFLPIFLGLLIALVTLLIIFFTALFKIILIIFISFLIYLFTHKTLSHLHYKKILQVSFHAATVPLTIDYLLPTISNNAINVIWLFFVYLIFNIAAVIEIASFKK